MGGGDCGAGGIGWVGVNVGMGHEMVGGHFLSGIGRVY